MADRIMFRGDTMIFNFQVVESPPGSPPTYPGTPQDITGWKFWSTVKNTYSDPDNVAVLQVTSAALGGIVVSQPLSGIGQVTYPASATAQFPDAPVKLVYDIQAKDTQGNIFTIESGTVTVIPDVTRSTS